MTDTLSRNASRSQTRVPVGERNTETLARTFDIEGLRLTQTVGALVMDGRVPSYRMKKLAGQAVDRLLGGAYVVNRLRVAPYNHRRDAELGEAVRAALAACSQPAGRSIVVSTEHGIVVLQGSICCSACRSQAEAAAWAVGGVVDVANRLRVARSAARHGRAPVPSFLSAARR
jgi:osmotically-inducible protein OsmY